MTTSAPTEIALQNRHGPATPRTPLRGLRKEVLDAAMGQLVEFVQRDKRRVLIVEPKQSRQKEILSVLTGCNAELVVVEDGPAAETELARGPYDCVIEGELAVGLDPSAIESRVGADSVMGHVPVITYGPIPLEDPHWRGFAGAANIRRAQSRDRLLDQAALVLHRPISSLDNDGRQIVEALHKSNKFLAKRRVLVVDDDMRNIFALTTLLEEHEMVIYSADNGRDAIRTLQEHPDIEIVLMDIMMPEMDGIDTMREIRKFVAFRDLPIVAVTAKAMKGDREKCIEAGAWDYLAKPVDTEQLLAVLRAWLHR